MRCILLQVLTFIFPVAPESKVFLEHFFFYNVITYHTLSLLPAFPYTNNGTNMSLAVTKSKDPSMTSSWHQVISERVFSAKKGQVWVQNIWWYPSAAPMVLPGNKGQMPAILGNRRKSSLGHFQILKSSLLQWMKLCCWPRSCWPLRVLCYRCYLGMQGDSKIRV